MTLWERDGDEFRDFDVPERTAGPCPDCGVPWPIETATCPGCSLSEEALRDAADFLDRHEGMIA